LSKHTWDTGLLALTNKLKSVGWFYALLVNGTAWMPQIINLFVDIGRQGSGMSSIGPSEILGQGVDICAQLLWSGAKSAGHLDMVAAFGLGLSSIAVIASFTLLTLHFLTAQIEVYYAIGLGSVFLMLGGSKWTVSYVERYFSFCVQAGIKMMVFYFAVGGAQSVMQHWNQEVANMGSALGAIVGGYVIAAGAFLLSFTTWHIAKMTAAVLGGAPIMTGNDMLAFTLPATTSIASIGSLATGGAAAAGMAAAKAGSAAGSAGGSVAAGAAAAGSASVPSPMLSAARVANIAAGAVRSAPNGGGHPPAAVSHNIQH
jgi:type IV secretion system protein TrbL